MHATRNMTEWIEVCEGWVRPSLNVSLKGSIKGSNNGLGEVKRPQSIE